MVVDLAADFEVDLGVGAASSSNLTFDAAARLFGGAFGVALGVSCGKWALEEHVDGEVKNSNLCRTRRRRRTGLLGLRRHRGYR